MDINGLRDYQQTLVVRGVAQGAVAADKTVNVRFWGTTIKCRAGRGVTTALGDVVLVFRSGNELVVVERFHAAAPTGESDDLNSYPPNPWNSVQYGSSVIHPIETRSFRDDLGWRSDTDDTLQGNWGGHNHAGCAFYGTKPASLLGSQILSASIKVKRDPGSSWSTSEPTTLKRIEEATLTRTMIKDKTEPTYVSGTTTGPRLSPSESRTFTIPTSWGQDIVDGVAGGLAIHTNTNDPKARLEGRHSWGPAWTLVLSWRRVV